MIDTSKIIHGVVGGGRYTVTSPIVKEDYGLYLKIEGLELPSTYEVDFSNSEHNGTSVTMIGNADGVLIPSQFIKSGKDVFAFLYHVGADFGRTVYKFRIPNKLRPDRTNEQPTPEHQSTIDQAISALNEAVAQTAQDVIDADASAQASAESARASGESALSASNSALSSGEYASNALSHAESASASATASAQSASASAQSASEATQAKQDAQDSANEAKGYATQASNYADDAQSHANTAHGYATSASESAGTAISKASEASGYAQTASQKATEAGGYADTSSQKASESAQSASLALGYKNDALQAKTDAETAQASAEQARDDAQTAQELAETAESNAESTVHGVLDSLDLETTSGSIVETHDAFPVSPEKMVVDINPVQEGSGDPSPENIRPITGWDGCKIDMTGKNLFGGEAFRDAILAQIPNAEVGEDENGRYIKLTASSAISNKVLIDNCFKPETQYTFFFKFKKSNTNVATNLGIVYVDGSIANLRNDGATEVDTIYSRRLVTAADKTVDLLRTIWASGTATIYYDEFGIFEGDVTEFEPYKGTPITINLGQTVYGGKRDVLSGVQTVDRAIVDLGTLTWQKKVDDPSYGTFFYAQNLHDKAYGSNIICSVYVTVPRRPEWGTLDKIISGNTNSKSLYIRDSSCNNLSANEFKTAMSGVQLVYELGEPIEYQLTPQQITLFKGYNALWADTGDISEFAYRAGEFATETELADIERKVDTNKNSRMQMGAHRGAESYAPPNSVAAYEIAGEMGFPWAWLAKIRWSTSGTLYVMHDADVSITTNGTGNIQDLTDEYISGLLCNKITVYDYSKFTDDDLRVPTLEKVIQICLRYGMKMCFRIDSFPNQIETELHQTIWDNFERLIKEYGISADWCCYSGYNYAEMTRCITLFGEDAELCPYLGTVSAQDVVDWFNAIVSVTVKRKSVLLSVSNLTLADIKLLHSNGIKVYAFTNSTTPTQEQMEQLAYWGVDILQNPRYAKIPIV